MPTTMAARKPNPYSTPLAAMCGQIVPFVVSVMAAWKMRIGELRTTFLTMPRFEATCQTTSTLTKPSRP